jgi:DNA-binding PadR family transcriptional regulator
MEALWRLDGAILGLLHQAPCSGYELRKVLSAAPWGSFSDSPGAVYPALRRLERRGWIEEQESESGGGRGRRVLRLTPRGLAAWKAWLARPVTRDDVVRGMDRLLLRFAFMEETLGRRRAAVFLAEVEREISAYLDELRRFYRAQSARMSLSGRLAFANGVAAYAAQARWARRARQELVRTGRRR